MTTSSTRCSFRSAGIDHRANLSRVRPAALACRPRDGWPARVHAISGAPVHATAGNRLATAGDQSPTEMNLEFACACIKIKRPAEAGQEARVSLHCQVASRCIPTLSSAAAHTLRARACRMAQSGGPFARSSCASSTQPRRSCADSCFGAPHIGARAPRHARLTS